MTASCRLRTHYCANNPLPRDFTRRRRKDVTGIDALSRCDLDDGGQASENDSCIRACCHVCVANCLIITGPLILSDRARGGPMMRMDPSDGHWNPR